MRDTALFLLILLLLVSIPARAEDREAPPEGEELRFLDPSDPHYRTPRAGEGFRTRLFGRAVASEPRDRRSTSVFDAGVATWIRGPDHQALIPFASFYFWRRPDERRFLRATVAVLYNDVVAAYSLAPESPFEGVLAFESMTIPSDSALWVDGERIDDEEVRSGWVRGAAGLGYRRQVKAGFGGLEFSDGVNPQSPDNMFSIAATAEPKYLYFSERNSISSFVVPQDTFELQGRLALRWDALERNVLDLTHRGLAVGFDATYGWRANWENWGIDRVERAERGRHPRLLQTYAVVAIGVPGVTSERHRLIHSLHAGWGGHLDRFSAPRVGGGPGGDEFLSLARVLIPGASMSEYTPDHYAVGVAEYRYELFFFTYLSARAGVAWLDRDRLNLAGVRRQNDFLTSIGGRLTTVFLFKARLQVDYNYNFDVVRDRERGGNEVVAHISKSF
jgi:hypothetical protein